MGEPFLLRALLAGLGLALVAAPLGCFVVWRRMAYYGETVAQAGLIGIALGLALSLDLTMGVLVVTLAVSALLVLLGRQQIVPFDSLLGLLAHTALAAPFVVILVSATLAGFDKNQTRAGASLGANPVQVFRRVTMPLIMPGIASGAVLAFVTSFDEVVVVLFLAGPEQHTLTREMWKGVREQINPAILALCCLLVVVSLILLVSMEALRRRSERLRGIKP